MKIGIIGGGINGLSAAWKLSEAGHSVDLYERAKLMNQTSRASSKLLHGGLRYLEQGEFRLVREALRERDAWLKRVPELTKPIRLVVPVYDHSQRSRWLMKAGLFLYDNISGRSSLPKSCWLSAEILKKRDPDLVTEGLRGGFEFSDVQMDDYELGLWVAEQARLAGCKLHENRPVTSITLDGQMILEDGTKQAYDRIVNVSGPWATKLLENSRLSSTYKLDTVRGSHLVINRVCQQAYLLEVPAENRIFFVLPWKKKTLIGTTEVRQTLDEEIVCSAAEQQYLLDAYNQYQYKPASWQDIIDRFAGIRPLIYSSSDPGKATREYAIEQQKKLINVFGGKWTTALALAKEVTKGIH